MTVFDKWYNAQPLGWRVRIRDLDARRIWYEAVERAEEVKAESYPEPDQSWIKEIEMLKKRVTALERRLMK